MLAVATRSPPRFKAVRENWEPDEAQEAPGQAGYQPLGALGRRAGPRSHVVQVPIPTGRALERAIMRSEGVSKRVFRAQTPSHSHSKLCIDHEVTFWMLRSAVTVEIWRFFALISVKVHGLSI